jgi:MFS family permease
MTKPATKDNAEFKTGWPVVLAAMVGIGLGLSPVPFYTIGMMAPELVKAFGWSFGAVMGGLPIMTMAVIIASPLVGLLADRFGVRRVTLISVALFGLAFMAFSLSTGSLLQFYITWGVMAALGAGTLPITWTRAVNGRFEQHKGLALGLALLGTGLFGYAVKPLAAWLITEHGWRAAYLVIGALPLLIALPIGYFCFHEAGAKTPDPSERRAADAARIGATPGLSFKDTIRTLRFWVLATSFTLISFAIGGPIPNMENILKLADFNPSQIVHLVSLLGLSVIAGRIIGGWLIDRFWAPGVAFFLLSAPAAGCWILAHGPLDMTSAAACIVLIGFAAGVEYDLMAFLVARYFGMKTYATTYGALYGFFALGAGFGPVIFGRAFDKTGSYDSVLMVSMGLLLAGALILLTLGRYGVFKTQPEHERAN